MKIKLSGWKLGFSKVKLNKLLQDDCGLGLKESKEIVDNILVGKSETVKPRNPQSFIKKCEDLGAVISHSE